MMRSRPNEDAVEGHIEAPTTAETVNDTLFGGSRFMAWTIGPVAIVAAIGLALGPWACNTASVARAAVLVVLLMLAVAVIAPRRGAFAGRVVTGAVFLACLLYVVEMAIEGPDVTAKSGDPSLGNALQALVVFGIPCFWLTVRRRRR
ncbi:MAG: hypothetical protein JNK78_03310 [Planctomycetes bacterium]|nr:hypothetical protein [Planctomycetota bacterium]